MKLTWCAMRNRFVFSWVLRDSTSRFICPSDSPSRLTFFMFLRSFTSLLLPKCSGDYKHCPCLYLPARNWGSRVSGLIFTEAKVPLSPPFCCFIFPDQIYLFLLSAANSAAFLSHIWCVQASLALRWFFSVRFFFCFDAEKQEWIILAFNDLQRPQPTLNC